MALALHVSTVQSHRSELFAVWNEFEVAIAFVADVMPQNRGKVLPNIFTDMKSIEEYFFHAWFIRSEYHDSNLRTFRWVYIIYLLIRTTEHVNFSIVQKIKQQWYFKILLRATCVFVVSI